jgi:hypothetical protein
MCHQYTNLTFSIRNAAGELVKIDVFENTGPRVSAAIQASWMMLMEERVKEFNANLLPGQPEVIMTTSPGKVTGSQPQRPSQVIEWLGPRYSAALLTERALTGV